MTLVRESDAGNPPVRFDEREVEREHGMRLLRDSRGNRETEDVEAYSMPDEHCWTSQQWHPRVSVQFQRQALKESETVPLHLPIFHRCSQWRYPTPSDRQSRIRQREGTL
jgi:hypothetical protein